MKSQILILICLSSFSMANAQSPWVAEKGKGYAQLGYTTIGPYSNLYLNGSDNYSLTREVTDKTIQFYGEYGLGSGTSIITSIPLKLLKTGSLVNASASPNAEGSFTTIGNAQVAVKRNFINNKIVFSGQLLAEIPGGGYDEATGLRGGLDAVSIVPSLSLGKGFSDFYGFVSTGFAIRTNDYSNEFRISAEAGYKVMDQVYLIAVLDIVENLENGNVIESINQLQSGLYLNNQSFFAFGFKTIIGLTDSIGLSGAVYGASSGNLVAKSPSLNLGVYFKW